MFPFDSYNQLHVLQPPVETHSLHKKSSLVEVYDSGFVSVLGISPSKILHMPAPSMGVSRLVLCRNYKFDSLNHIQENTCLKGEECKFVHADVSNARRQLIHVNYAWRSEELCSYPRLPPGEVLTVLSPNNRLPSFQVRSEMVLVTRGSTQRETPPNNNDSTSTTAEASTNHSPATKSNPPANVVLSHCAHYHFNRMCNRGDRCNFIHKVHTSVDAVDFQRAPAPVAVAPLLDKTSVKPSKANMVYHPQPPPPFPLQQQPVYFPMPLQFSSAPFNSTGSILLGRSLVPTSTMHPYNYFQPTQPQMLQTGGLMQPLLVTAPPPTHIYSPLPSMHYEDLQSGPESMNKSASTPPQHLSLLPNPQLMTSMPTPIPMNVGGPQSTSMTSFFLMPNGSVMPYLSSQQQQTTVNLPQTMNGHELSPFDWSFHSNVYNNVSSSLSSTHLHHGQREQSHKK